MRLGLALSALCACIWWTASGAWAQGVVVCITPPDTVVTPGDIFEVHLSVTVPGPEFNAYDAVIGYDTNALTFLPRSPLSLQEGSDMKGACGNTFHLFSAQADSMSISHSLLCGTPPVFLTGPAELYTLRFQASLDPQVTEVELRSVQFFRAGVFVDLESSTNATIEIGEATDVGIAPEVPSQVRAAPNPFNPATILFVSSPRAGHQIVRIWDARGRLVRQLQEGSFAAGQRSITWNGHDGAGKRLPSGVYHVVLDEDGRRTATRVVLLK
jgi:hypothetical protein